MATPRWGSTDGNQRHARTNSCALPLLRGRLRRCHSEPAQRRRKPSAGGGSSGPLIHSSRGGRLPTVNFLLLRPATPTNKRTDIVCKAIPSTSFRGWLLKEQAREWRKTSSGGRRWCQSAATTGTRFSRQFPSLRCPVLLILGQGSVPLITERRKNCGRTVTARLEGLSGCLVPGISRLELPPAPNLPGVSHGARVKRSPAGGGFFSISSPEPLYSIGQNLQLKR